MTLNNYACVHLVMKLFKNENLRILKCIQFFGMSSYGIKNIFIENYGFSVFKRRIGRPHIIPGCIFIVVFIACPNRVKKRGQPRIRQGQPYL